MPGSPSITCSSKLVQELHDSPKRRHALNVSSQRADQFIASQFNLTNDDNSKWLAVFAGWHVAVSAIALMIW